MPPCPTRPRHHATCYSPPGAGRSGRLGSRSRSCPKARTAAPCRSPRTRSPAPGASCRCRCGRPWSCPATGRRYAGWRSSPRVGTASGSPVARTEVRPPCLGEGAPGRSTGTPRPVRPAPADPYRGVDMSQDAIVMLKADHKEVRGLFREFQKASTTPARKGKLVEKIIELLTVHTYIENEVMYPRVRALLPDLEDDVLESYEEHHVADLLVMELVPMTWKDERFVAKATVLIENVEHHIEEEEQDWFPKVRDGLTRTQLREIGAELAAARDTAPRSPAQPSALKKTLDAVIA